MVAITICRRDGGGEEGRGEARITASIELQVCGRYFTSWALTMAQVKAWVYLGSRPVAEFHAIQSKSGNMAADLRLERSRFRGS